MREFTINTTDGVNFAVSANTRNSSSGMVWALCTASESDGKLIRANLVLHIINLHNNLHIKISREDY